MWKTELLYRKRKTGIEEKISMPVFFIITLVSKAAEQPLTTARSAGEIKA